MATAAAVAFADDGATGPEMIRALEAQKVEAVSREDYDTAKKLKRRIEELKAQGSVHTSLDAANAEIARLKLQLAAMAGHGSAGHPCRFHGRPHAFVNFGGYMVIKHQVFSLTRGCVPVGRISLPIRITSARLTRTRGNLS